MKRTFASYGVEGKVFLEEAALSNAVGETFYAPNMAMHGGGSVSPNQREGSYPVRTTTIDAFCAEKGIRPTFIKMDIEGAEPYAVEGARETIARCRPRCAISIYHAWQHFWEIPLQMREIARAYRFFVKQSQPFTEVVLYAVPEEYPQAKEESPDKLGGRAAS